MSSFVGPLQQFTTDLSSVEQAAIPYVQPVSTQGGALWMRQWSLLLTKGVPAGQPKQSLDLSPLNIEFTIDVPVGPRRSCVITVRNLGLDQMAGIAKEYNWVTLTAGYVSQSYKIFDGPISWFARGRESPTDTSLEIHGNEYDTEINTSAISVTLPAGSNDYDKMQACITAMNDAGSGNNIQLGYVSPSIDQSQTPRSQALFGSPRDVLRDIAQKNNASWHVADGKLNMVAQGDALNTGSAVVLNSKTGLIGTPRLTFQGGISGTCLLNGNITKHGLIQLNEQDINQQVQASSTGLPPGLAQTPEEAQMMALPAQIAWNGIYTVLSLKHRGNNRSQEWYTDFQTEAPGNIAAMVPKI